MAIKGAALLLWPPLRQGLLLGVAAWVGAGLCLGLLPASPLPEARAGASRQRRKKTGSAWEGGQLFSSSAVFSPGRSGFSGLFCSGSRFFRVTH